MDAAEALPFSHFHFHGPLLELAAEGLPGLIGDTACALASCVKTLHPLLRLLTSRPLGRPRRLDFYDGAGQRGMADCMVQDTVGNALDKLFDEHRRRPQHSCPWPMCPREVASLLLCSKASRSAVECYWNEPSPLRLEYVGRLLSRQRTGQGLREVMEKEWKFLPYLTRLSLPKLGMDYTAERMLRQLLQRCQHLVSVHLSDIPCSCLPSLRSLKSLLDITLGRIHARLATPLPPFIQAMASMRQPLTSSSLPGLLGTLDGDVLLGILELNDTCGGAVRLSQDRLGLLTALPGIESMQYVAREARLQLPFSPCLKRLDLTLTRTGVRPRLLQDLAASCPALVSLKLDNAENVEWRASSLDAFPHLRDLELFTGFGMSNELLGFSTCLASPCLPPLRRLNLHFCSLPSEFVSRLGALPDHVRVALRSLHIGPPDSRCFIFGALSGGAGFPMLQELNMDVDADTLTPPAMAALACCRNLEQLTLNVYAADLCTGPWRQLFRKLLLLPNLKSLSLVNRNWLVRALPDLGHFTALRTLQLPPIQKKDVPWLAALARAGNLWKLTLDGCRGPHMSDQVFSQLCSALAPGPSLRSLSLRLDEPHLFEDSSYSALTSLTSLKELSLSPLCHKGNRDTLRLRLEKCTWLESLEVL